MGSVCPSYKNGYVNELLLDAVRRVVLERPTNQKKCRTKTTKMLDQPTIDELISQVKSCTMRSP